jgi:hypothetical protein
MTTNKRRLKPSERIQLFVAALLAVVFIALAIYVFTTVPDIGTGIKVVAVAVATMYLTTGCIVLYRIRKRLRTPSDKSSDKDNPPDKDNPSDKPDWKLIVAFVVAALAVVLFTVVGPKIFAATSDRVDGSENYLLNMLYANNDYISASLCILLLVMLWAFGALCLLFFCYDWRAFSKNKKSNLKGKIMPRFYKKSFKAAERFTGLFNDLVLKVIAFLRFMPDFFAKMYPLIFQSAFQTLEIEGRITDRYGNPLNGVLVRPVEKIKVPESSVTESSVPESSVTGTTSPYKLVYMKGLSGVSDSSGRYKLQDIPRGVKEIRFLKYGYDEGGVTLISDASADISLTPLGTLYPYVLQVCVFTMNGITNAREPVVGATVTTKFFDRTVPTGEKGPHMRSDRYGNVVLNVRKVRDISVTARWENKVANIIVNETLFKNQVGNIGVATIDIELK